MSNALDTSLEDLIRNNKRSNRSDRGSFRGRTARFPGSGPVRRLSNNHASFRPTPYPNTFKPAIRRPSESYWLQQAMAAKGDGTSSIGEMGARLYVSNLDYGVSNDDIKELFSEVGRLEKYSINYDRSGRSKGTAEIFFSRQEDAISAVKRYNNVELDGKPMKIEMVTPVVMHRVAVADNIVGRGRMYGVPRNEVRRGFGAVGRPRGGFAGSRGRGFGMGRGRGSGHRGENVSVEALDAELDKYHTQAMQTN